MLFEMRAARGAARTIAAAVLAVALNPAVEAASQTTRPRTSPSTLSPSDVDAVRRVTQAYRDAWLANDPERVMSTLLGDAVLLPSGLGPIEGHDAIRRFW